jgi:hypothetical protein
VPDTSLLDPDAFLDCPLQIQPTPFLPGSQNDIYSCLDTFFLGRAEIAAASNASQASRSPVYDENKPGYEDDSFPENTKIIAFRISRDTLEPSVQDQETAAAIVSAIADVSSSSSHNVNQRPYSEKQPFRFPFVLHLDRWAFVNRETLSNYRQYVRRARSVLLENVVKYKVLVGSKVQGAFFPSLSID